MYNVNVSVNVCYVRNASVFSTVLHTYPAPSNTHLFNYMWYSPFSKTSVLFKVRACSDVHILLAKFLAITDDGVYEIIIGEQSNQLSLIRYGIGGSILVQQNTQNVLHCSYAQWFWIDWSRGISVGAGSQVGDSVFLQISSLPHRFDISAVSVATGQGVAGDWELTSVPGY
jgi:Farnesoic acid 0-methyl transferase